MSKLKRPSIEIYCSSEDQKEEIKALAQERGMSVSKFLIEMAFSNGRDSGARRRAEGALANSQLHWKLGEMAERLLDRTDLSTVEKANLHELIQDTRREIALKRLQYRAQEIL
ncbi:hypothetical protein H6G89_31990 [Oscillatoria sp. FACHB-1407]|nr:hypothetical protein [Oscillatoria sp. FACHB-1407]